MALDLNSMLMPIQPLAPMPLGAGPGENLELERQRLELMRQQFDETKRRNAEEQAFQQMEEQGRNARQQLQLQQAREEHAAVAKQKMDEDRRAALGAVLKAHDAGDFAGMEAAALQLNQLGGMADKMSTDAQGFPSYRIGLDRAAWEQQQAAQEAQAAPRTANPADETAVQSLDRMSGLGYGLTATQPDASGNVPANVLDAGLEHQALVQRLSPALDAYRQSFAPAYQESTGHTNDAALAMSMNPKDTLEAMKSLRTAPDASIAQQLTDQREQQKQQFELEKQGLTERAATTRQERELAAKEPGRINSLRKTGSELADTDFKNQHLGIQLDAHQLAEHVRLLANDDSEEGKLNQQKVVNDLMRLSGNDARQSESDAARVTGLDIASWSTKLQQLFNQWVDGGYSEELRKAMVKYADDMDEQFKGRVGNYLTSQLDRAERHPDAHVAEGIRIYLEGLPKELVDQYEKDTGKQVRLPKREDAPQEPMQPTRASYTPASASSPSIDAALRDAGLDPEKARPVLGLESGGGNPRAVNPRSGAAGIIQFTDKTARQYLNPNTGKPFANAAEFGALPLEQQAPLAAKYLRDHGVNERSMPEDYAMATAAPGFMGQPRNTVVYKKGTDEWDQNPRWRPKGGGDITVGSILDAYGLTSSGQPHTSRPATPDEVAGHEAKPLPQAKAKDDQRALDILNEANQ